MVFVSQKKIGHCTSSFRVMHAQSFQNAVWGSKFSKNTIAFLASLSVSARAHAMGSSFLGKTETLILNLMTVFDQTLPVCQYAS